jgi:hypothetical protein
MSNIIYEVEALTAQLNDMGKVTIKNAIITKILCALPVKYKSVATIWDTYPEKQ